MKKTEDNRRSFLKHVLAATAVVAGSAAIVRPAKAKPAAQGPVETLYRESENFKKYYQSLK